MLMFGMLFGSILLQVRVRGRTGRSAGGGGGGGGGRETWANLISGAPNATLITNLNKELCGKNIQNMVHAELSLKLRKNQNKIGFREF